MMEEGRVEGKRSRDEEDDGGAEVLECKRGKRIEPSNTSKSVEAGLQNQLYGNQWRLWHGTGGD
jgi:hypothetical protein